MSIFRFRFSILIVFLVLLHISGSPANSEEKLYLGVDLKKMTPSLAQTHNNGNLEGVLVASVVPFGPADEVGIRFGDTILELNRKEVKNIESFLDELKKIDDSKSFLLLIRRKTKILYKVIKLETHSQTLKKIVSAASNSNPDAQSYLGEIYANGKGVTQDYAEAVNWLRKAANQGNAKAQKDLGEMYANGHGVLKDYVESVKWFREAAYQGNAKAQNNLGVMYVNGHGVLKDYAEAVKWFYKAVNQGNANAQKNLGFMYVNGHGVLQDYAEAVKWFHAAGIQGNANAQNYLGEMYVNGQGILQDYAEAVKWYQKSAEQKNAVALNNLGVMYQEGRGVNQDYKEARKWYLQSAQQEYPEAQYNLGIFYLNGWGGSRDAVVANSWMLKASVQGHLLAKEYIQRKETIYKTKPYTNEIDENYYTSSPDWDSRKNLAILEIIGAGFSEWARRESIKNDNFLGQMGTTFIRDFLITSTLEDLFIGDNSYAINLKKRFVVNLMEGDVSVESFVRETGREAFIQSLNTTHPELGSTPEVADFFYSLYLQRN